MAKRKMNAAMLSSENQKCGTPSYFMDWLRAAMPFNLDPCAEKQTAQCPRYYTKEDDGLAQNWGGDGGCFFYMNSEYGDQLPRWTKKARFEAIHNGASGMCLVPTRPDTIWWTDAIEGAVGRLRTSFFVQQTRTWWLRYAGLIVGFHHVDERLKFLDNGVPMDSAPFPSSVIIFINPGNVPRPPRFASRPDLFGGRPLLTVGMPA